MIAAIVIVIVAIVMFLNESIGPSSPVELVV